MTGITSARAGSLLPFMAKCMTVRILSLFISFFISTPLGVLSHATRHTPHATRHTPHATRHTPHATRHTPHATRHTPHATRHTPHATRNTQHAILTFGKFTMLARMFPRRLVSTHTVRATHCAWHAKCTYCLDATDSLGGDVGLSTRDFPDYFINMVHPDDLKEVDKPGKNEVMINTKPNHHRILLRFVLLFLFHIALALASLSLSLSRNS
jgi:hypothetical protein